MAKASGYRPLEVTLARDLSRLVYDDPSARRAAAKGALLRIRRGAYVAASDWAAAGVDARYRTMVEAVARGQDELPVLSHWSAASVWGLPVLRRWPREVHITRPASSGGRSRSGIAVHGVGIDADEVVLRHGLFVTTLERTLVDMAAIASAHTAVSMVDAAIHVDRRGRHGESWTTRARLLEQWGRMLPFRGSVRARSLIEFADERSGSVGESSSRVTMALAGFPRPLLQRTFRTDDGEFDADFYFEEADAIGESDGRGKYVESALRSGRSPEQVVYDEKVREDALRAMVRGFTRWDFDTGLNASGLRAKLERAGLVAGAPRLWVPAFEAGTSPRAF